MATKHICDYCGKEIYRDASLRIWTPYGHPLSTMEMCTNCFAKHWKPVTRKFSLIEREKIYNEL